MNEIKAGDWITAKEGTFAGKPAVVRDFDSATGMFYVYGDGFGWKFAPEEIVVIEPPEREPWLNETFGTDVDGFLAAYAEDDNVFWRMDSGHAQNVIDELLDRLNDAIHDTQQAQQDKRDTLVLLAAACEVIHWLSEQQAMPDDFWVKPLARFRAAVEGGSDE